jgi:Tol biopolymer transport system component
VAAVTSAPRTRTIAIVLVAVLAVLAGGFVWSRSRSASSVPAVGPISLERVTGSGDIIDAVISPDGNNIAYVRSAGGRQGLWVRQLAGTRPIELVPAGPFGFWGITFSPDGQSVYYTLRGDKKPNGGLYAIPTLGGQPKWLLDNLDTVVTFSPDGRRIAYYRYQPSAPADSALVIANVDGSSVRAVVVKRTPEGFLPGFFAAPSWSPDGVHIATTVNMGPGRATLAVFDAADGTEQDFSGPYVLATATRWLTDGSAVLFIARDAQTFGTGSGGQIYLQPYPAGTVRRITNDVMEYRNVSLAGDGRTLVSVGYDVGGRISVMPTAGGDIAVVGPERYDGAFGISWTPDGANLLFTRVVQNTSQIWISARDGADARALVTDGLLRSPVMSPDGATILFAGFRAGKAGIWRAGADGGNPRLIATVADADNLAISPDGKTVYFTSSQKGTPGTYSVAIGGGTPVEGFPLLERAAVSPDGRMLAGVWRRTPDSRYGIATLTTTGQVTDVLEGYLPPSAGSTTAFTPDGKSVLFTSVERVNIWKHAIGSNTAEKLTNFSDSWTIRFALSPDGQRLAMCRGAGVRDAFLIRNFR